MSWAAPVDKGNQEGENELPCFREVLQKRWERQRKVGRALWEHIPGTVMN